MSLVAGIDCSSLAVDVVWIDEDAIAAPVWRRYELQGADAWERTRSVRWCVPDSVDEYCLAVGIEVAHGMSSGAVNRVVGAVLARISRGVLVKPWTASEWKRAVGLPGNASKEQVRAFGLDAFGGEYRAPATQDCFDAYCIALATLQAIERKAAA